MQGQRLLEIKMIENTDKLFTLEMIVQTIENCKVGGVILENPSVLKFNTLCICTRYYYQCMLCYLANLFQKKHGWK